MKLLWEFHYKYLKVISLPFIIFVIFILYVHEYFGLQISTITLILGDSKECVVDLKFSLPNDVNSESDLELLHFKHNLNDKLDFDNIRPLSVASIVPRESRLNVVFDHQQPALVGEWYEIKAKVTNEESYGICDLQMKVNVIDNEEQGKFWWSCVHVTNLFFSPLKFLEWRNANLQLHRA